MSSALIPLLIIIKRKVVLPILIRVIQFYVSGTRFYLTFSTFYSMFISYVFGLIPSDSVIGKTYARFSVLH